MDATGRDTLAGPRLAGDQDRLPLNNLDNRGDPVSVVTGNLQHTQTDIAMSGPGGFGLTLTRSYNSRLDYAGPLGFGWVHTYDQHLRFDAGDTGTADDRVIFVADDGSETPFEDPAAGGPGFLVPPAWYHSTLERKADGSLEFVAKDGTTLRFAAMSADRANLNSIQVRNGSVVTLGYTNGKLTTVNDPANRGALTFSTTSDGAGGSYVNVTDWSSPARTWRYRIDAQGDLVSYTDPEQVAAGAAGKPATYSYYHAADGPGAAHNLRCMVFPETGRPVGDVAALCGAAATGHVWTNFVYYANDAVYEQTTSAGETTRFFYDLFRRRTTVTYPDGAEEAYIFDRVGNTIRSESPRGVIHEYEYAPDTRNRLREIDGFGNFTFAEYDAKGNVTRRIDRLGHEERWSYDSFSAPLTHTDRRGKSRQWVYDWRGNLTQELAEIDGLMETLARHEYDALGNLTATTVFADPGERGARKTRFAYASNGVDLTQVTDPLGHATRLTNDALGRPTKIVVERSDDAGQVETIPTTIVYDRLDRVTSTIDSEGVASEVEYDANGEVREVRSVVPQSGQPGPSIEYTRYFYDAADRKIRIEDRLARETTVSYDLRGRPLRVTDPAGSVTTTEYDLDGNAVATVDPLGAETRFEYDGDGRLVRTLDALGRESRIVHDDEGRVLERWAPGNRRVAKAAYDEEGNPFQSWDAADHRTDTVFDELGRVRATTVLAGTASAATTTVAYDLTGAVLSRTDAESHTARFSYDALGRLIESTDPLGRSSGRRYDDIGDLVEVVNAADEHLQLEYDRRGNLLRRSGPGVDDRFTYDSRSRLRAASNAETTLTFEYDEFGRPIAVSDPNRLGTVRQSYDAAGRVKQIVYPTHAQNGYPAPSAVVTSFHYDPRGQLAAIFDPSGNWQFEYDALGRLAVQRSPSGERRKVRYTPEGYLDRIDFDFPSGADDFVQYGNYDALGQPRAITTGESATATAITYHPRGWVQAVTYPDATTESVVYDKVGNRTQHQRSGTSVVYDHDAADQLTRIATTSGTTLEAFGYDGAGRRTTHAAGPTTTDYGYDALGRLTTVSTPDTGHALALFYDAAGARTRRTETSHPQALFLGGWIESRDGVKNRLLRAPGASGPLAEIPPAGVQTLHRDGSGNITKIGQAGAAISTRRYDVFGTLRSGAESPIERGYAGLPREGASGLRYAGARHYDPATGRFLQPDPAGLYQPNLYAYAANNPIVYGDPSGLAAGKLSFSGFPDWLGFDLSSPSPFPYATRDVMSAAFSPEGLGAGGFFAGMAGSSATMHTRQRRMRRMLGTKVTTSA